MSRTKDEILWLQPQPTPNSVTMDGAKRAMDEWAKQVALEFYFNEESVSPESMETSFDKFYAEYTNTKQ